MKHDIVCSCRHWSKQMHKAASAVEDQSDGSVEHMRIIDGNRAVAETLEAAASAIEKLRAELAQVVKPGRKK